MRALISNPRVNLPAALLATVVAGCQTQQPTDPAVAGVEFAQGGGPGPTVDSTDPPSAEQDTTLDVRVLGSGFDEGSGVNFLLDGNSVATIHTNSVTFVSRKELRANITIDLEALTDLYDVEVLTSGGKRGIGADLFAVVEKGGQPQAPPDIPTASTFDDTTPDCGICSDGGGAYENVIGGDVHSRLEQGQDIQTNEVFTFSAKLNSDSSAGDTDDRRIALHLLDIDPDTVWFADTVVAEVNARNPQIIVGYDAEGNPIGQRVDMTAMSPGETAYAVLRVWFTDNQGVDRFVQSAYNCSSGWPLSHRVLVIRNSDDPGEPMSWTIRPREDGDNDQLGPPQPMKGCMPEDTKKPKGKPGSSPPPGANLNVAFELTVVLQPQ